eukprot:CAMPEP_0118864790 /NCGR_PEP_ID=MMETSP1163-20130328/9260_1 /TAXON_ID=124430 /ORGANISM="Phaeomonas parva, Strain CCMP2877" /LENGTH=1024 /DNA_ID=CAMNT_0006798953 /DNA_START=171 /DNA_END=3245 /DNA_ORIENTATION=-
MADDAAAAAAATEAAQLAEFKGEISSLRAQLASLGVSGQGAPEGEQDENNAGAAHAEPAAPAVLKKVTSTSASEPGAPPGESSESGAATTAAEMKERGNRRFKQQDYSGALALYSRALLLDPSNHLLYSNRAACQLKLGQHAAAAADAQQALSLCPRAQQPYVKGYHRLTQALLGEKKFDEAQRAVEHGLRSLGEVDGERAQALLRMLTDVEAKRGEHETALLEKEGLRNAIDPRRKPRVKEFDMLEELGHGNFSTIVRAEHKTTKEPFAMKVIHKRDIEKTKRRHPNVENEVRMEKRVLLRCRGHPNIVYLYHTLSDYSSLFYLTELCTGGEIWARLRLGNRAAGAPRSLATFWTGEVVRGLGHLHANGVVHRDIKPENLLVDHRGRVKLADFGTAKDLREPDLNGPEFCGTPEYMCPEAVSSKDTGFPADLWALGCVVYNFLTGYPPFRAHSPYLSFLRIKKGHVRYPEHVGPGLDYYAHDLISSLIVLDPAERAGAADGVLSLLEHPFFKAAADTPGDRPNPNPVTIDFAALDALPCEAHEQVKFVAAEAVNARATPCFDSDAPPVELSAAGLAAIVKEATPEELEAQELAVQLVESLEVAGMPAGLSERLAALSDYQLACVRMALRQHGKLHERKIWKALTRGMPLIHSRALRASTHTREYVGMEKQQQGSWVQPFFFAHAVGPASEAEIMALVTKLNAMRPAPAFLTFSLPSGDPCAEALGIKKVFLKLSQNIPVLFVPGVGGFDRENFGADWYGFWFQGFRGLVINSNLLTNPGADPEAAERMEEWLDEQLEQSKLASQRAAVFTAHPWCLRATDEDDPATEGSATIPLPKRARWLNLFRKEEVDLAITGTAGAADARRRTVVRSKVALPKARRGEPDGAPRTRPRYDVKLGAYVLPNREAFIPGGPGEEDEEERQRRLDKLKEEDEASGKQRESKSKDDDDDDNDDDDDDDDDAQDSDAEQIEAPTQCLALPALSSASVEAITLVTVSRYETKQAFYSLDSLPETVELPAEEEVDER